MVCKVEAHTSRGGESAWVMDQSLKKKLLFNIRYIDIFVQTIEVAKGQWLNTPTWVCKLMDEYTLDNNQHWFLVPIVNLPYIYIYNMLPNPTGNCYPPAGWCYGVLRLEFDFLGNSFSID
jgi:hypothetical protein